MSPTPYTKGQLTSEWTTSWNVFSTAGFGAVDPAGGPVTFASGGAPVSPPLPGRPSARSTSRLRLANGSGLVRCSEEERSSSPAMLGARRSRLRNWSAVERGRISGFAERVCSQRISAVSKEELVVRCRNKRKFNQSDSALIVSNACECRCQSIRNEGLPAWQEAEIGYGSTNPGQVSFPDVEQACNTRQATSSNR